MGLAAQSAEDKRPWSPKRATSQISNVSNAAVYQCSCGISGEQGRLLPLGRMQQVVYRVRGICAGSMLQAPKAQ